MQKQIIFGQDKAFICNDNIKNKIINYLYTKIDLSKYRYNILNNIQKLNFLKDNEHYVSPNYKGYNYLLMMLTIDNIKFAVALDRRKLSYHKNQLDMNNLTIIQLQMNINDSFYDGTIFNGKLIMSNNQSKFLIQDCFYLMGKNYLDIDINAKMEELDKIIQNNFIKNYCKHFEIKLNKLYQYDELDNLINVIIPSAKIPVNGLIFYPLVSGINIMFIDKKVDSQSEQNNNNIINNHNITNHNNKPDSNNLSNDYVNILKNRIYNYELTGKKKYLWLSKTDIPDVFNIHEKEYGDKLGIAAIPNLKTSYLCASKVGDKPTKFNCIYNDMFKKWIPLEVAHA